MAITLGEAFVALHFDGKALPAEAEAQIGAAMAAATETSAAAMGTIGAEGEAAGAEIAAGMDGAAASIARVDGELAAMGATAKAASGEAAAAGEATAAAATKAGAAAESAAKSTGLLGMSWKTVGEIAGGAAVIGAIKSAGDYQQALTKLATTAGESFDNLDRVGQGMLKIGDQVGYSGNELAKAMYIVESSMPPAEKGAQRASDALTILKASAQGAKQEGADLGHVVDAVTTSLHDYHLPASEAANVTSQLIAAVSHGKVTFDDLTGAMHSVEPRAAAAGLSIAQTAGALAAMTASGMSADQAAQNLAHTIQNFEKPTQPMIAELAQLGITATDLSANLGTKGIAGTLQEVSDAIVNKMDPATKQVLLPALNQSKIATQDLATMIKNMPPDLAQLSQSLLDGSVGWGEYRKQTQQMGGQAGSMATQFLSLYKSSDGFNQMLKSGTPAAQQYLAALGQATGTADALNTALQLTGHNAAYVNGTIADVAKTTSEAGGNIKGWAEVQQNFNQRMSEAWASVKNFAIEVGQHLLPGLTSVATWIVSSGVPALQNFGHWLGQVAQSAPVQAAWSALVTVGKALLTVLSVVGPILGTIGHLFSAMPKPVQDVVVALLALKALDMFNVFTRMSASSNTFVSGIGRMGVSASTFRNTYSQAMNGAAESSQVLATEVENLSAQGSAALDRLAASYGVVDEAEVTTMGRTEAFTTAFSAAMPRLSAAAETAASGVQAAFLRIQMAAAEAQAAVMNAEVDMQLGGMFAAAGPAISNTTGKLAGLTAGARAAASEVGGAFRGALGGVMGMLGGPFGVALIGATIGFSLIENAIQAHDQAVAEATQQMKGYFSEIAQGGQQSAADIQKVSDKQNELVVAEGRLNQLTAQQNSVYQQAGRGAGAYAAAINEARGKVDDLKKEYNDAWNSLDPLQQAQVKLNTAVHQYGPASDQAAAASRHYQDVLGQEKAETDLLNSAEKTHLQQLEDQGQKQIAATNAALASQQATLGFKQQLDQLNAGMADGSLKGNDLTQAQLGVAQAAISAANAAGQQAAAQAAANGVQDTTHLANEATLEQLKDLAAQMGGHVPQAISDQIAALEKSDGAQAVAAQMVQNLTDKIHSTPDGKVVTITAPTAKQIQDLEALGFTVQHVPGSKDVIITANTAAATAAMKQWTSTHWETTITGVVQVRYTGTGIYVGNRQIANAMGNIVHAYDAGGFEPMMAGMAQTVGPNTWRIIGDRAATDEAYIPLDGSPRSEALWAESGRRMGLLGPRTTRAEREPVAVTYAPQYTLPPTADAEQVAAMVGANTARDFQLGLEGLSSLGLTT